MCDRADIDQGDRCWQCNLQVDIDRYERSVVSIAEMRRRVDSEYTTADKVDLPDPIEQVDSDPDLITADSVSYVWACNGRFTHEDVGLAA
jgi:hypothetical protein